MTIDSIQKKIMKQKQLQMMVCCCILFTAPAHGQKKTMDYYKAKEKKWTRKNN